MTCSQYLLSGAIPDLSTLTALEELYLSQNRLTGAIPDLSTLTALRVLYLNENQLSGGIPTELGTLTKLTHLFL